MYMGVIKDEARTAAKRQKKLDDDFPSPSSSSPSSSISVPTKSLFERQVEYEQNLKLQSELAKEQGLKKSSEERERLERERRGDGYRI